MEEKLYDKEGITALEEQDIREEEESMPMDCTPHYGCCQCKYYDECPDGRMFM